MAANVVNFITENIFLFLPLGIAGITTTIFLYLTGEKGEPEKAEDLESDFLDLFKFNVNFYFLIYLFVFVMLIISGFLSNFAIPVIVGGILASIPMFLMIITRYFTNRSKVL